MKKNKIMKLEHINSNDSSTYNGVSENKPPKKHKASFSIVGKKRNLRSSTIALSIFAIIAIICVMQI